jgi:hypothetical protein
VDESTRESPIVRGLADDGGPRWRGRSELQNRCTAAPRGRGWVRLPYTSAIDFKRPYPYPLLLAAFHSCPIRGTSPRFASISARTSDWTGRGGQGQPLALWSGAGHPSDQTITAGLTTHALAGG